MKKFILCNIVMLIVMALPMITACSDDDDDNNSQYSSLFAKTDYYVNKLGYSGSGGVDSSDTSDGNYTVSIMGRIIVVKKKYSSSTTYSELESVLYNRYKSNSKVKDVYKNNAGTITIDCRN